MSTWVRLKNQEGQVWDSRIGWGIKLDEVKELPEDVPAGSLTAERLRMGGLIVVDPPIARDQDMFVTAAAETVQVPVVSPTPDSAVLDRVGLGNLPGLPNRQAPGKKPVKAASSRRGKKA